MHTWRMKMILAAVIATVVFGLIVIVNRGERSRDLVLSLEPLDTSDDVTVFVGGAVDDPGLYVLPRGSRLSEAIDLAGPLDSADTSRLPMAQVLSDEQSILVPEIVAESDATQERTSSGESSSELLNVNQASQAELETLPGIGPALAERIVERRVNVGPFTTLEEMSDVSGISDRMVDEIREHASVEP
jgi:competence protein ComEA